MPAFKPEPRTAVVKQDFADARFEFVMQQFTMGVRPAVRVTVKDSEGQEATRMFRLSQIEPAVQPKAKRKAVLEVLSIALQMTLADVLDGEPDVIVVPSDPDDADPIEEPTP